MRILLPAIVSVCLALSGCAGRGDLRAPRDARRWDGEIRTYGALRAMIHEGRTDAAVTLDTMLPNPHLYAVGALADLAGEITVVGGRAYLAYPAGPEGMRIETTPRSDAGAALLVVSEVPAWNTVVTGREIRYEELDEEIARMATAAGIGRGERFPFLVEGTVRDLQWHVIDGRRLSGGGTSHEDHLAAAARAGRERVSAVLVGFHSESDQGRFTHRGSRAHIHCVVDGPLSTGHVDHVTIPAGTAIRFPVVARERPGKADRGAVPGRDDPRPGYSVRQTRLQPSPETRLPSSQSSPASRTPFPQDRISHSTRL